MKKAPCRHSRWEAVSNVPWACKREEEEEGNFVLTLTPLPRFVGKRGGRMHEERGSFQQFLYCFYAFFPRCMPRRLLNVLPRNRLRPSYCTHPPASVESGRVRANEPFFEAVYPQPKHNARRHKIHHLFKT